MSWMILFKKQLFDLEVKVPWKSLQYVTHCLMVMPIKLQENAFNSYNYVSPSNEGRHICFFLLLPLLSRACPDHNWFIFPVNVVRLFYGMYPVFIELFFLLFLLDHTNSGLCVCWRIIAKLYNGSTSIFRSSLWKFAATKTVRFLFFLFFSGR
jgi:hypothetical protein